MAKLRLDTLLHRRGVFPSRSRAAASVLAGEVLLAGGRRAEKPGQMVAEDAEVSVAGAARYASRGGHKLANALGLTGVAVQGRRCLDVGASTGGFTDCLLQAGAAHVIALDVAYGELDWGLRNDERVTVVERTNARGISAADLDYAPDLIVADVSFISLRTILPAVLSTAADRYDALVMCKPQFEVGRERLGKGGVVREPELRLEALLGVAAKAQALGASVLGFAPSGLPGPKGNLETFVWLAEGARGSVGDLEAAARAVEP